MFLQEGFSLVNGASFLRVQKKADVLLFQANMKVSHTEVGAIAEGLLVLVLALILYSSFSVISSAVH